MLSPLTPRSTCAGLRRLVYAPLCAVAWLSLALSLPLCAATEDSAAALSAESFRAPPADARVHTWWHWVDGAITREGITKDLETMKSQGVVQATILNVSLFDGRNFGVPRVPFASDAWFGMYRWALSEAARLGIRLGVHNCDGWSSSGGPWITPEESMKQYTWTKALVAGGRPVDLMLSRPTAVAGLFRDVAVVAYRTRQQPTAFQRAQVRLAVNGHETPLQPLADGNPVSAVELKPGDQFVLAAPTPLTFSRVALHLRRPFMWSDPSEFTAKFAVEVSDDGQEYRRLAQVETRGLNANQIVDVPQSSARFVRVSLVERSNADSWLPLQLSELELLQPGETPLYSPTIPFLGAKTSAGKGPDDAPNRIGSPDQVVAPADVVVLTDRMDTQGRLRWEAPEGTWAILRFGYTSTGATNAPATNEGRGLECDKMDAAAVEHHFHAFTEKLIDQAGSEAGKTLRFILIDSWEAGFQNWTDRLPAEFKRRRGYDLLAWLPVLTGETVASPQESEAVLYDFRRTIADLIRENYYDRFAELLHARGVELHAEVIYGGMGYPPLDVLRATQQVDLPMMEFWTSTDDHHLLQYHPAKAPMLQLPPAAAVGYEKPRVGSEAYTGYAHYSETPADLKPFGDRGYVSGINRMILHSNVHQPTDAKPGMTLGEFASHFNRNNLYWQHAASWIDYQSRIQLLLGQGTPQFDVLYFLGDQLPQLYTANGSTTLPSGYAVDAINADILEHRVDVVNGRLRLNGQGEAALLSLPPEPRLSLESLRRIEALVRAGAHVYGVKPTRPLSLADTREAAAFQALVDQIWGAGVPAAAGSHAIGKGAVHWGTPIGDVLHSLQAPQFEAVPTGDADLMFTHRTVGGADVFFVFNQLDKPLDRECLFRVAGKAPEIWDPETGTIQRPGILEEDSGRLRLPMHFGPRQALLFVFRDSLPRSYVTRVTRDGSVVFPAANGAANVVPTVDLTKAGAATEAAESGNYAFTTNDGHTVALTLAGPEQIGIGGLAGTVELHGPAVPPEDATLHITELRPLSAYQAPAVRYFAGEAVYRLRFSVPAAEANGNGPVRLDLGGFSAIAEVTLNGEPLGQFWRPGVPIDVTGRLRSDNELLVRVVTVYRNRFIGDLKEFGEVKNLWTSTNIKDQLSADSPLKPSGWFGPLTLTRVSRQTVSWPQ